MAWALQFDGVNDYLTIASTKLHTESGRTTFEYEIYAAPDADQTAFRVVGNAGAFTGQISILTTGVQIRLGSSGASQVNISYTQVFDGLYHTYKIRRDGNNYSFLIDGVSVATTTSAAATGNNGVVYIGRVSGNYAYANIGYIIFRDSIGGTDLFNWDATTSNHAAGTPILTETVAANNATGVNMPTDGSAWIDLGGGGVSGAITQTTQSFTQSLSGSVVNQYTGTITQNTQSFTQSASGSVTSEPITGVINQTVSAFTQSALGNVVSSGINGAINQTASAFNQSATGSAVLNISGVISQTVSAFTQSLSGTVAEQISGTINQTVSSFTMSAVGRVPASWTDKLPASTAWADQTAISTIWTDK